MNTEIQLRALNSGDIASFCKIIRKIGMKELGQCLRSESMQKLMNGAAEAQEDGAYAAGMQVALEIADIIIAHIPNCEKEIFDFLADLSGKKAAAIKALPPADTMQMIVDVTKKEEFADFIKVVSRLFKSEK